MLNRNYNINQKVKETSKKTRVSRIDKNHTLLLSLFRQQWWFIILFMLLVVLLGKAGAFG